MRKTCVTGFSGCTPSTTLVSFSNDGSIANAGSNNVSISADGRFIAFGSLASNLVPGDNFEPWAWKDIFVRDTCYGAPNRCMQHSPGFCGDRLRDRNLFE